MRYDALIVYSLVLAALPQAARGAEADTTSLTAQSDDDIVILSVKPRDPSVRPIMVGMPADAAVPTLPSPTAHAVPIRVTARGRCAEATHGTDCAS